MGSAFKKPTPPALPYAAPPVEPGKWVENFGQDSEGLGTYRWEGPEPPDGRPENPANTPEGKAYSEQIAERNRAHQARIRRIIETGVDGGARRKKRTKKSKKAGRRHKRSTKRRHSS